MTLESTLHIRPGEGRRVGLLFLHLALASAVFYLGRTVRDTLFLSRYPLSALPWMYVVYGAASSVVAVAYARFADRLPRQRQIAGACLLGSLTFAGAWWFVRSDAPWIYPAFYVWTEIVANVFIVQFWTLANDMLDARAARRLYGTIGSARLLSSVVVGLAAGALVRGTGTAQLILVLAGIMLLIAAVSAIIGREVRAERTTRAEAPARRLGRAPSVLADPYVRALAMLLLVAFTAVNIGDYQFKAMARATWREDQLARFFALFYAGTGALSFLFQIFLTPRILARLGVGAGMSVMPLGFGAASAGLFAMPGLFFATLVKFADNGFQFAIQETTFQALYVPFAAERKVRTRAYLESVVKPLGFALAGVVVLLWAIGGPRPAAQLCAVTLPLTGLWLLMVPRVKRLYQRELEATLSARGAFALDSEFVLDASGRGTLIAALSGGTPRHILAALEQLAGDRSPEVRGAIEALTRHDEAAVRRAALEHLAADPGAGGAPLADGLRDPDAGVRGAAALAWAAHAGDESVEALVPLLTDPSPDVQVAALAGLLRHGGVEGGIVGGVELGRLLQSKRQNDLVRAARALAWLGTGAYRPLRKLLDDADPVVRRAALKAAPGVADPRLVPVLLQLLSDSAVRKRAGNALVAVGAPAVPGLGAQLTDNTASRAVRLEIPRLLRRIPATAAYQALRERAWNEDSRLRLRIYAAMSNLRRTLSLGALPLSEVQSLVTRELDEARRVAHGWQAVRSRYSSPLLAEMFTVRRMRVIRRLLRLLELRYDPAALRLARDRLDDPGRRANALELLDSLLEAPLRPLIMPYVDAAAPDAPASSDADAAAFLRTLARHPNPYFALVALDALAADPAAEDVELAQRLSEHPDALVREGAEQILLKSDTGEKAMYSTLDKILLLKSAPVFERVSGEDLAPLARVAELEIYSPGAALMVEGETGDTLYVVVKGKVNVTRNGRPISTLGPGDSVGEMAVLDRVPRSATATAMEETEVLRIGSEEFYEILHEQVEIAEGVIRVLCARLRQLDARLAEPAA